MNVPGHFPLGTSHCEQAHFWHMHDPYTTLAESVIAAPKHPLQPASGTRIRSPCALAKAAALLRHLGRHTATHAHSARRIGHGGRVRAVG